ncbi:MAG: hypothetical protein V4723_22315 [Pseudomonadota bacterium]
MPLEDVLATQLLTERPARPDQPVALQAVHTLLDTHSPLSIEAGCEHVLKSCHAESAGVSLFSHAKYDELTWLVVRGHLARFQGRRFPHRHSMCGVCFDLDAAQLFVKPHLHFQWMQQAGIGIREALVAPLKNRRGQFEGTMWVMTHTKDHVRFNGGDLEVLELVASKIDFSHLAKGADNAPLAPT